MAEANTFGCAPPPLGQIRPCAIKVVQGDILRAKTPRFGGAAHP